MNHRELFFRHIAQTSPAPLALEIVKAEGCVLTDAGGKEYIDLIGGISVANTGHRHPVVLNAMRQQMEAYLHIMVYGEFIEGPQVRYAKLLTDHLPASLNTVYFTNSGTEAVEGAMKLAKRVTGRTEIISFKNSYHGSTQGSLSIMGDEEWRNAFRPLLPGITHLEFNSQQAIDAINELTACVIAEPVQAEAGIIVPDVAWMKALRDKCTTTGTLLILDEIQTGFGRTGRLWGFENSGIVPDVLLLGKALGGGMPLGAFIADQKLMTAFTFEPVLGHITTFGGHPLSCAAGHAGLQVLLNENILKTIDDKATLFKLLLHHRSIKSITSSGLWLSVRFESFDHSKQVVNYCIQQGVITDWFLFAPECLRISPPLTISESQIRTAAQVILEACDTMSEP